MRPTDAQGAAWTSSTPPSRRPSRRCAKPARTRSADAGRTARRDAEAGGGDDRRRQHRPPGAGEFYASLNDEQKAKFNRLGREHRAIRAAERLARDGFASRSCQTRVGAVRPAGALRLRRGNATFGPIFSLGVSGSRRCGESILASPGPYCGHQRPYCHHDCAAAGPAIGAQAAARGRRPGAGRARGRRDVLVKIHVHVQVERQQSDRAEVRDRLDNFITEGRDLLGQIRDASRALPRPPPTNGRNGRKSFCATSWASAPSSGSARTRMSSMAMPRALPLRAWPTGARCETASSISN